MKNIVILVIACIAAFALYTVIQNNPSMKATFDDLVGNEPTVGDQVDQAIDSATDAAEEAGEAVENATGN